MLNRTMALFAVLSFVLPIAVSGPVFGSQPATKAASKAVKPVVVKPSAPQISAKSIFARAAAAYAASQSASYTATLSYLSGPDKHTVLSIAATEQKAQFDSRSDFLCRHCT